MVQIKQESASNKKAYEIVAVDIISYEESLKYLDIPDQLTEVKAKSKEKRNAQDRSVDQGATSSVIADMLNKQKATQPKKSIDQLYNEITKNRLAIESGSKMSLTVGEVSEILGLSDSSSKQFIKVEFQVSGSQFVLLITVDSSQRYA